MTNMSNISNIKDNVVSYNELDNMSKHYILQYSQGEQAKQHLLDKMLKKGFGKITTLSVKGVDFKSIYIRFDKNKKLDLDKIRELYGDKALELFTQIKDDERVYSISDKAPYIRH